MLPYFIPVEHYRKKIYSTEKTSRRFLDITEEQLEGIEKKVDKKRAMMDEDITPYEMRKIDKLDRYQKILQYLTNPMIHLELKTFDEKMAFMIKMCDPNLVTYREFLKRSILSFCEVSKVQDKDERIRLIREREQALSDYEAAVREQIGFYDPKLLRYEEAFFKRYYGEKELITGVNANNQDNLIFRAKFLKDFDSVSDERYQELIDLAQSLLALVPDKFNTSSATYSVLEQKKLLGLKSTAEQLALFVLLVDSELDMLRIYEEESMMPMVKERIIEEFGYFNTELLALERKYHKRFCPDKKVSVWTKVKND